jgi:hypothetical protein
MLWLCSVAERNAIPNLKIMIRFILMRSLLIQPELRTPLRSKSKSEHDLEKLQTMLYA